MHWILLQAQGQDLFVYLPIPEKAQTSVTWVELVSLLIAPCNIKKRGGQRFSAAQSDCFPATHQSDFLPSVASEIAIWILVLENL